MPKLAQRIAIGFETIQLQLRRIIRDLVPVEVDKQGLAAALRSLARRTADDYGLDCQLACDDLVQGAAAKDVAGSPAMRGPDAL